MIPSSDQRDFVDGVRRFLAARSRSTDVRRLLESEEGFDREVMMEPGRVYRVAFQVGWLSQVFNRGHRIRVTVASTGAPFYEPNPNTGEPLTIEWPERTVVAENTVQHNRRYASRVVAPVVSGGTKR